MILSDKVMFKIDTKGSPTKAHKVWLTLMLQVSRGNLVLGATETRLAKLAGVAKITLLRSLQFLETIEVLKWDRDLAVVRLNPRFVWEGIRMEGEEWENAIREWEGIERDEDEHSRAQMDYLFGPGGPGWRPGEEEDQVQTRRGRERETEQEGPVQ